MSDGILPFDPGPGLPQRQRVKINNIAYDLEYAWNSLGSYMRLKITRVNDSAVCLSSKLADLTPLEARDPATYESLFAILPYSLSEKNAEVWVFWEE